jgi:peptidoglycan/xylan/chitin deacetylase (PgdA/CDA1 family)
MVIKRRTRGRESLVGIHLKLVTLAVLISLLYFFTNFRTIASFAQSRSGQRFVSINQFGNIQLTPPPPTSTPTLTPTPTPIPLVGYCLNVPVIMYHHIQPTAEARARGQTALSADNGVFDQQMAYLAASGYSTLSAGQLIDALMSHTALPAKSIVITMDDGYNDIYNYAYPILQKYHITANLAVITGLVGGGDYVNWGQISEMSNSGLVHMINHTWSHYAISQLGDKARYEVATAKQQLQDHTGKVIDTFVYPYGFINSSAIAVLQQEGVRGAFSEIGGHWQCDSFIMSLHRTRIGNSSLSSYGL